MGQRRIAHQKAGARDVALRASSREIHPVDHHHALPVELDVVGMKIAVQQGVSVRQCINDFQRPLFQRVLQQFGPFRLPTQPFADVLPTGIGAPKDAPVRLRHARHVPFDFAGARHMLPQALPRRQVVDQALAPVHFHDSIALRRREVKLSDFLCAMQFFLQFLFRKAGQHQLDHAPVFQIKHLCRAPLTDLSHRVPLISAL